MNRLRVVLYVSLFFGANTAISAVPSKLTSDQIASYQAQVGIWKRMLDEYHQGKRDDRDGHAILFNLLMDYGILGQKDAPEVKEWKKEYDAIRQKYPEFRKHPPVQVKEQIQAQENDRKHENQIAEKSASSFIPKDSQAFGIYGYDHHAIVQYQYHLDFYKLDPPLTLKRESPSPLSDLVLYNETTNESIPFVKIKDIGIKPFKVLTFRNRVQLSLQGSAEGRFVWVCDDLMSGYSPSDNEEHEILRKKYPNGPLYWHPESADYSEFCGALGVDGNVLYRLPKKQHIPDTLFDIGPMTPDGTSVIISIGEKVDVTNAEDGDTASYIRHIREALLWTYPDRLLTFDAKEADKVIAALKAHGFLGRPWPWN